MQFKSGSRLEGENHFSRSGYKAALRILSPFFNFARRSDVSCADKSAQFISMRIRVFLQSTGTMKLTPRNAAAIAQYCMPNWSALRHYVDNDLIPSDQAICTNALVMR